MMVSRRRVSALGAGSLALVLAADWGNGSLPFGGAATSAASLAEQDESGPFPKSGLLSVIASGRTGSAGTADDPAIWVHPTDRRLSVIIGTDKTNNNGGLHVFDLNGVQLQFVTGAKHNNVDVRYGFLLDGERVDLVSACDRNDDRIDIYKIDPDTQRLTRVGVIQTGINVYGYAMYHNRETDKFYGIVASEEGVEQWEFVDAGGTVGGVLARKWSLNNQTVEGIVADDELGHLYLAEEDRGIFKYGAEPGDPTNTRVTVDLVRSATQLVADVEGLTIYYRAGGLGYLIASSQGNDRFVVYRREGDNDHLGTFQIASGPFGAAIDTDGIDVINMNLGPSYPLGLFVAQNDDTDFKIVRWDDIADALGLAIHTTGYDVRGGDACADVASVSVSPPTVEVEVGAAVALTAVPLAGDGTERSGCGVTWSTDAAGVATVDATGLVTGISVGTVDIVATSGTATGVGEVTVVPSTNEAPVVDAGADLSSSEGASMALVATFSDLNADDVHTATVDWGDGSPVQPGVVSENGDVTGLHVYANQGTFTATVAVHDGRGGIGQDSVTVTVANILPIASAGGPYSGVEGVPVQFSGSALDPGADVLTYEWDFDYDGGNFDVEATGLIVQHTYAADDTYVAALRVRDDVGISDTVTAEVTVADRPPVDLYFTLASSATIGGVSVANEDIVAFDGSGFTLVFDGSDVGLGSATIDAFTIIGPTQILLSFTSARSVSGVGTVDDSDIVIFTATSLGPTTAGSFAMYFDGSDVGLSSSSEDVDAVERLPDGRLIVSTTGSFSVPGASGAGQDLLVFTPASTGPATSGAWAMYFDGSDVGLSSSSEGIDAVAVDAAGRVHLSTTGGFSVSGVSGADEDVFVFTPAQLGSSTAGTYVPARFFDGSLHGVTGDVVAIDLP